MDGPVDHRHQFDVHLDGVLAAEAAAEAARQLEGDVAERLRLDDFEASILDDMVLDTTPTLSPQVGSPLPSSYRHVLRRKNLQGAARKRIPAGRLQRGSRSPLPFEEPARKRMPAERLRRGSRSPLPFEGPARKRIPAKRPPLERSGLLTSGSFEVVAG